MYIHTGALLVAVVLVSTGVVVVEGHGRLIQPPSRGSMWRYGFSTPINYNDNQLFCGGSYNLKLNYGKCGFCGDPYKGPHNHERGGKFYTSKIAETYTAGQTIEAKVEITASHKGWFEFRLCTAITPSTSATQACTDNSYLLKMENGQTRLENINSAQTYTARLRLPAGVTCDFCLLQWRYHTGNSWGSDASGSCMGCGHQEEFYGCANIAITGSGNKKPMNPAPPAPRGNPRTRPAPGPAPAPVPTPGPAPAPGPVPTPGPAPGSRCQGVGAWRSISSIDDWCMVSCKRGICPPSMCSCN